MTASRHTTPIVIPPLDAYVVPDTETIGATVVNTGNAVTVDLGTTVALDDGGSAMWVQAATAIPAFNAVIISSNFRASNLTVVNVASGSGGISKQVGWAQISIAVSAQGWVHNSGRVRASLAATASDNAALFCTSTPGLISNITVSAALVAGVVLKAGLQSVSAATSRTVIAPHGAMILHLGGTTTT